jgi:transposase
MLSGLLHVLRNGLRWQDAPAVYGPHKTLYNRFARWSRLRVFVRIFSQLNRQG